MIQLYSSQLMAAVAFLPFTADSIKRVAFKKDGDDELSILLDNTRGPVQDQYYEIDVSLRVDQNGMTQLFVQAQEEAFDYLNGEQINQIANLLTKLHETGTHFATAGIADSQYQKTAWILETTDGGTSWQRYSCGDQIDAFQPLEEGRIGIVSNGQLGQANIRDVVSAVQNARSVPYIDDESIDLPKGAVLLPRMVDQNGRLVMAYQNGDTTTIVTADDQGKLQTRSFLKSDQITDDVVVMAAINGGKVTTNFSTLRLTDGQTAFETNIPPQMLFANWPTNTEISAT